MATLHLFDFEGHGLSPTHPLSVLSVDSLAADLAGVFSHAGITKSNPATLIANSVGCTIALKFALLHPGLVEMLVLLSPQISPLPETFRRVWEKRSELVRTLGMGAVVNEIVLYDTAEKTRKTNPLAISAIRLSLLGQEPESFAKACDAFAESEALGPLENLDVRSIIIAGDEDTISSKEGAQEYAKKIRGASIDWNRHIGQWSVFEDVKSVSDSLKSFLL